MRILDVCSRRGLVDWVCVGLLIYFSRTIWAAWGSARGLAIRRDKIMIRVSFCHLDTFSCSTVGAPIQLVWRQSVNISWIYCVARQKKSFGGGLGKVDKMTANSNNLNVGMRCIKYMLFVINFMFVVSTRMVFPSCVTTNCVQMS